MPQMGESIAEARSSAGSRRSAIRSDKDEPLFEISTDKVDAEIPSPGAGFLLEIKVKEGETVPVQFGRCGDRGGRGEGRRRERAAPPHRRREVGDGICRGAGNRRGTGCRLSCPAAPETIDDLRRTRSSPLVRKIAKEHNVDIRSLNGTGISGRVTKKDILDFIESGGARGGQGQSASRGRCRRASPRR
jgi:2-oxoglutarate dehydrogenase E2 component (dihydrolipoamide succinyltransferase)